MTSPSHADQVAHALTAMGAGNPTAFLDLLSDDISYTVIGNTVFSGAVRGKETFLAQVAGRLGEALATPIVFELQRIHEDGNHVIVQARAQSTLKSGAVRVGVRQIRPTVDDQGRRDFLHVTAEAYATYGSPREYADDVFVSLESVYAPHIQGFVGYVSGKPAAAAALYLTHGVAGIGWVGTLPEQRQRGYAEAVTWTAIREGFRRGTTFANLQASPMGRSIYERMGFLTLTEYRVLVKR